MVKMLTTKPSTLPIMLPSSNVASLDRVLSITCANIVIDILCLDHLYQLDFHHHHHYLHKLPDHILAHLTGDFLDLLVDLCVVLVLQQQRILYYVFCIINFAIYILYIAKWWSLYDTCAAIMSYLAFCVLYFAFCISYLYFVFCIFVLYFVFCISYFVIRNSYFLFRILLNNLYKVIAVQQQRIIV